MRMRTATVVGAIVRLEPLNPEHSFPPNLSKGFGFRGLEGLGMRSNKGVQCTGLKSSSDVWGFPTPYNLHHLFLIVNHLMSGEAHGGICLAVLHKRFDSLVDLGYKVSVSSLTSFSENFSDSGPPFVSQKP